MEDETPSVLGQALVEMMGSEEEDVLTLVFESHVLVIEGRFIVYQSERVLQ